MNNLFDTRLSGERLAHEQSEINEQIESITSVRELTAKRILVSEFPYDVIDYNAEENYRKTGVDPNDETLKDLGRGIEESGLQQSIALIAHEISASELQLLSTQPTETLKLIDTWLDKGRISIIFGNRRYLAITNHTNLTHSSAFIYPKEALDWVPTISLIENQDREDVPLHEEAIGLVKEINRKYGSVPARYAKFSGRSSADINRLFTIGKACLENDDFYSIVTSIKTKDKLALSYIAQAITDENVSSHRKKEIDKAVAALKSLDGQITSIRDKASSIKNYAEGKKGKITGLTKPEEKKQQDTESEKKPAPIIDKPTTPNIKQLNKQLKGITNKFENLTPDLIDDEFKSLATELRHALNKLGL